MLFWACVPLCVFLLLLVCEKKFPAREQSENFSTADSLMNWIGFAMQGLVVPVIGYFISASILPAMLPDAAGTLRIGFAGAFLLNFVIVDFLYYVQHRAFHEVPWLWKLHSTHHYSPIVNVWATSRNALVTNLLFVYMLVNPILGFLCDSPLGFFSAAMLTAALDLVRHANVEIKMPWLRGIVVTPQDHHRHHDAGRPSANYGANFLIWDLLFGTGEIVDSMPAAQPFTDRPSHATQLLFPWRT
jgi:sterol desaturase/sphingolipid hydroxylase (fatty acid hydroxylase superfamily)